MGLDLLGWAGGGMGAVAYVLVSMHRLDAASVGFQGLNIVGAALMCVASLHRGALPSASMNVLWIVLGLLALVRHHHAVAAHRTGVPAAPSRDDAPAPVA